MKISDEGELKLTEEHLSALIKKLVNETINVDGMTSKGGPEMLNYKQR